MKFKLIVLLGCIVLISGCAFSVLDAPVNYTYSGTTVDFVGQDLPRVEITEIEDIRSVANPRMIMHMKNGYGARGVRPVQLIDGLGRIALRKGEFIDIVSQVKGRGTGPSDVQAFNGARQQAGAELGVFTCFKDKVTPRMRDAAASTGRFMDVQKVQIYTVEDFFEGRKPTMPKLAA